MQDILSRYAQLLVGYSLDIRPGDRLLIHTTLLAEPLVREVYRHALRAGAAVTECAAGRVVHNRRSHRLSIRNTA